MPLYTNGFTLEVLAGLKYDYTVDWWSLGILIYDMLTGSVSRVEEEEVSHHDANDSPHLDVASIQRRGAR